MFTRAKSNKIIKQKGVEIEELSQEPSDIDETVAIKGRMSHRGIGFLHMLAIFFFLFLAGRVYYLQVVKGDYYSKMSAENRLRSIIIKAPRGIIYDKNGEKLVQNIPSFDLVIIPADLPRDSQTRVSSEKKLAELVDMNDQSVVTLAESQDFNSLNPVLLKENISQDQALIFSERKNEFKGFYIDQTAVRQYENGEVFSPVMGYSGKISQTELEKNSDYLMTDLIGKTGLEYSYEKYLRGTHGAQKVEVDSSGNIKKDYGVVSPVPGSDLHLGLDAGLQKKIEENLKGMLESTGTKTASAVAINPQNGEILAMVNVPSYDNNLFSQGISSEDYKRLLEDENLPMFNRAISGEYPPGSTFKPLVASAALQEKTITSSTTLNCPAAINIGSYRFPDWKTHDLTDIRKAIAESVDIFFYAIGGGWGDIPALGIDKIQQYANKFGLGEKLGVDIPGEASGLVPNQRWKLDKVGEKWYVGDDYHCAIGQGFITSTPLQIANYVAAIANGGTVYQPRFVDSIKNNDGSVKKIDPVVLNKNFISPANLQVVREGMRQTVLSGTAQPLKDLPVEVAGKTGTAQFGSGNEKEHGWFVSFAPYDNPTIAMAVLVEGGGEGFSTAEPVTHDVYQWYFGDRK
ncbi:MAG: penicillin-binding protein 2 [Parcubacteria group bacterium]|jgi:penicillin-binding protein 2